MKSFYVLCLFHKETKSSLKIKLNGDFYCYGCGKDGNIKEYEELQNIFDKKLFEYLESKGQLCLYLVDII